MASHVGTLVMTCSPGSMHLCKGSPLDARQWVGAGTVLPNGGTLLLHLRPGPRQNATEQHNLLAVPVQTLGQRQM
eukprot:scaffold106_cov380-Prasinococcus_capsulatus_cf.AAC.43